MTRDHDNNPDNSKGKGKTYLTQMKRAYKSFFEKPCTMKMVAVKENIDRANICRYVGKWRRYKSIYLVKIGRCPETGDPYVGFYSTNPKLKPEDNQLSFFEDDN
ncbi:MAG: hypothetical protein JXQ96_13665 [Cyclobacteriaceae bacterium]